MPVAMPPFLLAIRYELGLQLALGPLFTSAFGSPMRGRRLGSKKRALLSRHQNWNLLRWNRVRIDPGASTPKSRILFSRYSYRPPEWRSIFFSLTPSPRIATADPAETIWWGVHF